MDNRIKVLQIIPTLGLGGAEIMVENLTSALALEGYDARVVSLYDCRSPITERLEGRSIKVYSLGKKKGIDLSTAVKIYRLLKVEKPDVVHTHLYSMPYVIPAAILLKIPARVHTIHNIAGKEVGWVKRKMNSFFYRFCRTVPVSISPAVKNSIIKEYRLPEEKVPMIYNGIELTKYIPKRQYVFQNDKISLLHIGRFSPQKNHMELIEAFNIVHSSFPNSVLRLIGEGELEMSVRQRVKELNLEQCIKFLGLQSDVHQWLSQADMFVLPSCWEGMPITLIEAMATGLPVAVSGVGGIPDMIEDNVTGLITGTDRYQISDALLRLIGDEELRKRLGNRAKHESSRFSVQKMENGYSRLYKDCINASAIKNG